MLKNSEFGESCLWVGIGGGKPGVEAEPADPEEERAHEDPGLKI